MTRHYKRILFHWEPHERVMVNFCFDPRDLWFGLFWEEPYWDMGERYLSLYLTIIPMLPIWITPRVTRHHHYEDY